MRTFVTTILMLGWLLSGAGVAHAAAWANNQPDTDTATVQETGSVADQVEVEEAPAARKQQPPALRPQVFKLRYASATGVTEILNKVLSLSGRKRGSPQARCLADMRTRSVIVTADPEQLDIAGQLIAELDTPSDVIHGTEIEQQFRSLRTRLHVEVFEVKLPRSKLLKLDAEELAKTTKTGFAFQETLSEYGDLKVLYRIDQFVDLSKEVKLVVGANLPFVRGTRVSGKTKTKTKSVEYQNVGCIVEVEGGWEGPGSKQGDVIVSIELSGLAESEIELGDDILAPRFYQIEQYYNGSIEAGRPTALLTIDGTGSEETVLAHVSRIVFELTE